MKHDIVYVIKNDYDSEELKYSLRSVCMNFPFRKIVIVGGCPDYAYPDIYIEDQQEGLTKWSRTRHSLVKALECDELTDDIWLFNDDFFVMDRVKAHEDKNYFNGTLEKRIIDIKRKNPRGSTYINGLEVLRNRLMNMNKDTLSFALHVPMLMNRKKLLELIDHPGTISSMFRSYYGNFYEIECEYMKDVKVYDMETVPDTPFISTSDASFNKGKVGEFLRQYFSEPCEYETTPAKRLSESIKEIYDEEGEIKYE